MNDIQNVIDRQLGIYSRFNYDNILKRLVVYGEESYYGLQNTVLAANFDQDPPIFACRFSEAPGREHILALANEDGRVAIQDTSTVTSASSLEGFQCHNNAVFDLAWMPQNMNFVTVSGDHTACLWDVGEAAPRRIQMFASHTRSVKTAVFRPTEPSVFATGARDGHILIWDIRASSTQPLVIQKPDNCLMNCHASFTPKTPGSHGKRPRIDNQRAISITGLVFQDDTTLISCGEWDGNIKVWDLRKNYNIYKKEPLPKHSIPYCGSSTKNGYTNLIIDSSRVRLYASCMDNVIYCFNISTYNSLPERRYVGHENNTFYIKTSLSPDSMYLVSGSSDKNAYIWNVKYSQPIVKLTGHWAEVTCAAWCQKGDTKIVTCSDDARHKIWRIGREFPDKDEEVKGRAEVVPLVEVASLPQWGALEKTPNSLKRKMITTPSSHSTKRTRGLSESGTVRRTKRCLTDLMNATRDADEGESGIKRMKLDMPLIPEGDESKALSAPTKRRILCSDASVPNKKMCQDGEMPGPSDWTYLAPKPGTSFMTPTKNYEKKNCKILSPKSPKTISPGSSRSPVKVSPTKVRIISITTPTNNLPNFVLDGEAPHLRLMSPVKKKQDTTDWLTLMAREKKGKTDPVEKINLPAPSSPKEIPARRNSATEKTPKLTSKSRTLLKYFSVSNKK
ncbi:protein lethal(2)denticleless [Aricia agestis]|uniref:protein lethal(2)denticleless n=1 Tax=Aricia agestis TaxID=91739 RepID=UPI001C2057F3|nr:protein lethal(2)denticleless [Aricia agestis]